MIRTHPDWGETQAKGVLGSRNDAISDPCKILSQLAFLCHLAPMRQKADKKSKLKAFNADHCGNPDAISTYLSEALETGESKITIKAIGNVARATGMTRIANATGLNRSNLYRSFGGTVVPDLETLRAVLEVFGVEFIVQPIKRKRQFSKNGFSN